MLFLLEYDRERGALVDLRSFDATHLERANQARLELELRLQREKVDHEVVLLEAGDVDQLRKTHRRYFATIAELAASPGD